ncbi:MAG: DUF3060 domain-containing protein [Myxococcaceae bacterium]|nr:DUF3060 domain-containing protein [Myxococcaceae bacterium]
MFRLVILSSCLASVAFAQIVVKGKDGKTVKVGTGAGGVEVQSGNKQVNVKTGGSAVQVEGSTGDEAGSVDVQGAGSGATVKVAPGSVAVENAGPAPTVKDGKWAVQGQGRTETHACTQNEDVEINGQGHTITLTGPCRSVAVNGQGNTVATDVAASIAANGMSNTVTWKQAATGKKPKISIGGMGNSVTQAK